MFSSQTHEQLLPFPAVPEALKNRHSLPELALRPFGIYERDLSVDFNAMPRPFLVTEILDCCTQTAGGNPVGRDLFWEMTVGTRIECLLRLVSADRQFEIPLSLRCPACGGELEIELTAAEISELQQQAARSEEAIVIGEGQVKLRRPTGSDQLAWLAQGFESEADALRQMLATLIVEGSERELFAEGLELEDGVLETIGEALDGRDPLVNFSVQVQCPECEREHVCEIDLEEFALSRLRQAQFRLLGAVHRLARHYHWSEAEIFKVPYWRRDHYLSLVEREKER